MDIEDLKKDLRTIHEIIMRWFGKPIYNKKDLETEFEIMNLDGYEIVIRHLTTHYHIPTHRLDEFTLNKENKRDEPSGYKKTF